MRGFKIVRVLKPRSMIIPSNELSIVSASIAAVCYPSVLLRLIVTAAMD